MTDNIADITDMEFQRDEEVERLQSEIDECRDMLEMIYNNSFRQPDGMWKILFSDQGRMNLKELISRRKK